MAVDHYENFPVASILLPQRLREPVTNIYRFARSADDIADEGNAQAGERLSELANYRKALEQIGNNRLSLANDDPLKAVFDPLALSIKQFSLPLEPFFDLLSAFCQDIDTPRYANDAALLDYCRRSANPVGRLMLHLYGAVTPQNLSESDAICTGLQLTNFWQDIAIDWQKERLYLPQDKLAKYAISEAFIDNRTRRSLQATQTRAKGQGAEHAQAGAAEPEDQAQELAWQALMQSQVRQARDLLMTGIPLTRRLPGRIGLELRLVVQGGLRILERLDALHYDMFEHRPTLKKSDWILLLWRAIL